MLFSWKMEQFSKLLHSLFCDYMTHSFTIMYFESERDSHSGTELQTIHCFSFLFEVKISKQDKHDFLCFTYRITYKLRGS